PHPFALLRATLCSGKLFHDRLRMERFHPRLDDDACALQFGVARFACVSRTLSAMKLRELGEDRLLAQLLPRLPRGKAVFAGAGDGPRRASRSALSSARRAAREGPPSSRSAFQDWLRKIAASRAAAAKPVMIFLSLAGSAERTGEDTCDLSHGSKNRAG